MNIIDKIKEQEIISRRLEPNEQQREELRHSVLTYTESFLNQIYEGKTFFAEEGEGKLMREAHFTQESKPISELIEVLKTELDTNGLNPASGGHLGYIPGGGIYASALGDYIADITNKYAGVYYASPGAVRMENALIRDIAKIIGYPENTLGNLTSGGSIANLICLVSARDAMGISCDTMRKTVIYASAHAHHCLNKAFRIAGMNEAIWREVPLDSGFRINTKSLKKLIEEDISSGLLPKIVIASAGTTDTGAIDPLQEIAAICQEHQLWMHVDAAYGGFFALLEELQEKFKGIELSDSAVLDPHKGLFLPYGTGVALVKKQEAILKAHHYRANYMQDTDAVKSEFSPADLSPELTKHFRGLRLWLPIKLYGLEPFKACLREKILLAQYFKEELLKIPTIEILCEPELSVVPFRINTGNEALNETVNEKLVNAIHQDGKVFLSSSKIDGKFIIRAAILSFRTHLETVQYALDFIKSQVHELTTQTDYIPHE
jgi:aromatic-L-amino-acid/L-tryptophan decarboxylase